MHACACAPFSQISKYRITYKNTNTNTNTNTNANNNANTNTCKNTVQRSGANAVQGNGDFPAPVLSLFSFLVQFTVFRFSEGLQSYTIKSMH